MNWRAFWLPAVVLVFSTDGALAQVVQLPSVSAFGVSTTVSVPDRGSLTIAGGGGASSGSSGFGSPFGPGNRGFGRNVGASRVGVSVTVHDFDAADRELLSGGKSSSSSDEHALDRKLSRASGSSAGHAPPGSVAEARRLHAAEAAAQERLIDADLEAARKAVDDAKPNVAAIYYRRAARKAGGERRPEIERELRSLQTQVAAAPRREATTVSRGDAKTRSAGGTGGQGRKARNN